MRMCPRTPVLALALGLAATAPPTQAAAQQLHGRVVEASSGVGIHGADVEVRDGGGALLGRTVTDVTGGFLFPIEGVTRFTLSVDHIGYETFTSDVLEATGAELQAVIRLGVDAIPLAPITVTGLRADTEGNLAAFESRRTDPGRVGGYFLTREDIQKRPTAQTTQLVEGLPGVLIHRVTVPGDGYSVMDRGIIAFRNSSLMGNGNCPATVFVDGVRVPQNGQSTLDDLLEPGRVGGIELYPRAATAPVQYQSAGTMDCGVALFWTAPAEGGSDWSIPRIAFGAALVAGLLFGGLSVVN